MLRAFWEKIEERSAWNEHHEPFLRTESQLLWDSLPQIHKNEVPPPLRNCGTTCGNHQRRKVGLEASWSLSISRGQLGRMLRKMHDGYAGAKIQQVKVLQTQFTAEFMIEWLGCSQAFDGCGTSKRLWPEETGSHECVIDIPCSVHSSPDHVLFTTRRQFSSSGARGLAVLGASSWAPYLWRPCQTSPIVQWRQSSCAAVHWNHVNDGAFTTSSF